MGFTSNEGVTDIKLSYDSTFDHGAAVEAFTFRMTGEKALLLSYDIMTPETAARQEAETKTATDAKRQAQEDERKAAREAERKAPQAEKKNRDPLGAGPFQPVFGVGNHSEAVNSAIAPSCF